MKKKLTSLIVALDEMNEKSAYDFLKNAHESLTTVKIGLELFYALGPDFLKKIHGDFGLDIFLDLKLHDIPNTVSKAIKSLKPLPVKFLTVHLSGGREMLQRALEETFISLPHCHLLGVSVLTSLGPPDFLELWNLKNEEVEPYFNRLFHLGLETKIPGIVLSGLELPLIKKCEESQGRKVLKVCPGIRFLDEIQNTQTQDQKRILTPQKALELGADYLVMGRSLTKLNEGDLKKRLEELEKLTK